MAEQGRLPVGFRAPGHRSPVRDSSTEPVRTCVGCRKRDLRSVLLRVVLRTDGAFARLEPDEARRKAGRGAWVHPDLECLNLAERRSAFQRALRFRGALESSVVRECIDRLLADRQPRQIVDPESGLETMSTQQ